MGGGCVVRLGDRWDVRGGVELGEAFQSECCSPHKGSRTEEREGGSKANTEPGRGTKGLQAPHPARSLIKAEGRAAGARAGTGSCLRLRDKLTASFGDPVRPPKLL